MIERYLLPDLNAALRDTPVTMLIGPRHTGSEAVRLAPKIWALPLPALWA